MKTFLFCAVILLPLLSLFVPLVMYLWIGWTMRCREITTSFTDDAIKWYFQTFFRSEYEEANPRIGDDGKETWDKAKLKTRFHRNYRDACGRSAYAAPAALLFLSATTFLVYWATSLQRFIVDCLCSAQELPTSSRCLAAAAGFAGGYMWVLFFVISRSQERRLRPADLFWCTFRLVIAVPAALALTAMFQGALTENALYAVAFMLGALPTRTLMTFLRRTASSKIGLKESFDEPGANLTELQGISRSQAETFSEEGIETILQLAYSDPVDLTLRTGYSFSYIVDCCSQALLWDYFERESPKLRRYGLRGAQEICTLVYELERKTGEEDAIMDDQEALAKAAMACVAKDLGMEDKQDALRRTFDEIAYDPYTQFLYNVWQSSWN